MARHEAGPLCASSPYTPPSSHREAKRRSSWLGIGGVGLSRYAAHAEDLAFHLLHHLMFCPSRPVLLLLPTSSALNMAGPSTRDALMTVGEAGELTASHALLCTQLGATADVI